MRATLVLLILMSMLVDDRPALGQVAVTKILGLTLGAPLAAMPGLQEHFCLPGEEAGETCYQRRNFVLERRTFQRVDYRFYDGKLYRFDARTQDDAAAGSAVRKLAERTCGRVHAALELQPPDPDPGMRDLIQKSQMAEGMGAGPSLSCTGQDEHIAVTVKLTLGQFRHVLKIVVEERSVVETVARIAAERRASQPKKKPRGLLGLP